MLRLKQLVVVFQSVLVTFVAAAKADMIGVSWNSANSPVVQINETTGTGTTVGLSGFFGLNSLAIDNVGTLYSATDHIDATPPLLRLVKINPTTGAGTAGAILDFGAVQPAVRALAFSPQDVLYAINNTGPPGQTVTHDLYTIDVNSGTGTFIGVTGIGIQGLDFSPSGVLYGWDIFLGLVTIDPATGVATDVNPAVGGLSFPIQTIAFSPNGVLYGAYNSLFTIDISTGIPTPVGSGGYTDVRGIEFLAVPEPGSAALLALALLALLATSPNQVGVHDATVSRN